MSEVSVKAKLAKEAAAEMIMKTTAEKDEAQPHCKRTP